MVLFDEQFFSVKYLFIYMKTKKSTNNTSCCFCFIAFRPNLIQKKLQHNSIPMQYRECYESDTVHSMMGKHTALIIPPNNIWSFRKMYIYIDGGRGLLYIYLGIYTLFLSWLTACFCVFFLVIVVVWIEVQDEKNSRERGEQINNLWTFRNTRIQCPTIKIT